MNSASVRVLADAVLYHLDTSWQAIAARLVDMTEDEYTWEPVAGCWTVRREAGGRWAADWEEPDPEIAPVTTIAWRCWHIAVDCLDSYSSRAFGASGTGLTDAEWVGDSADAIVMMDRAWSVIRAGVARWDDEDLRTPLGPLFTVNAQRTNLHLALHAGREIVHHGAEIALLRDLYRARPF